MKILVFFDAYASAYDIKEQIGMVNSIEGVTSPNLLKNAGGDGAEFCVSLDADDARGSEVLERVRSFAEQYIGYLSNLRILAYRSA